VTGATRKLHEAAAVLGGGALGALVAVAFGCGAFVVFVYGRSDPLHRDAVLLVAAQVLGILGFCVATLQSIRGSGIAHGFIGVLMSLLVVGFLGVSASLEPWEILPLLAVGACGVVPAAAVGLLARRIVDRSVARAEPGPGRRRGSTGS